MGNFRKAIKPEGTTRSVSLAVLSRVGKRHTLVIPEEVRRKVPIREGEVIVWNVEEDRIILKPASFRRLAGIVTKSKLIGTKWVEEGLEKEISEDVAEIA